ncbi:uncharacterized protein GIQ15_00331 [Arthroderma uncinatum]|uniref:uncharacterized protein n=1 Tax=Arthroderma uncinatum TaxID=74035 RepID=UPI00144ACC2B|nr:uncharacterized protein GIQ15_00331 [Arthroderma uncinatum]KAF3490814.1 hypothetical protein GIQ15_00331 [Arthroderma uncinatum]
MGIDSQQSSFTDDAPPSDSDSYFSGSEEYGHSSLFKQFPTRVELPPFTLSKRIFHWTEKNYQQSISRLIYNRMEFINALLARPPTQEETDALVSQTSSTQNMRNYGGAIGLGVGSMIARTKDPKPVTAASETAAQQVTPNRPLFKMSLKTTRGRFIRTAFILPIFLIIGIGIGEAVGDAYTKALAATDPRFARLREELSRADSRELKARLKRYQAEKLAAAKRELRDMRHATQLQQSEYHTADDNSPTGGYEQQGAAGSSYNQNQPALTESKILRETYRSQGENSDYSSSYSNVNDYSGDQQQQQQQASSTVPRSPSSSTTGGKSFWDDDASPVNSDFAPNSADSSSAPPSGSAWARIRQQSMNNSSAGNGDYSDSSSSPWQKRKD